MNKNTQPSLKDKLYYDSDCPICSAEMDKLCQLKNDDLELIPIKEMHADSVTDPNKLYDELHIQTKDGNWLTGYDANIYAWQQTKYKPVAILLVKPPLRWFGKIGYKFWLVWYQWQRRKRLKNESC